MLGCGDFRVGSQFLTPGLHYHGVDIVLDVIEYDRRQYRGDHLQFHCLDAIVNDLPQADLCLIREVLQHLSNAEIGAVMKRCRQFPFVVVTEAIAAGTRFERANVDIVHGANTRADVGSGVVLNAPPFSQNVTDILLECPGPVQTTLRSVLIDNRSMAVKD
jgi:hypothetical protein